MVKKRHPYGWWTVLENVRAEALRFSTLHDFYTKSQAAYSSAKKNNWLAVVTRDLTRKRAANGHWTRIRILRSAREYKEVGDWARLESGAYDAARNQGLLAEATAHMGRKRKPNNYWTKDNVLSDALRFELRSAWGRTSPSAYDAALRNGWLQLACAHMPIAWRRKKSWSVQQVCADAKRHIRYADWKQRSRDAFKAAKRLNCLARAVSHMADCPHFPGYWTKERVFMRAQKFQSVRQWYKSDRQSYFSAHRHRWFEEASRHMLRLRRPNDFFSKERLIRNAQQYDTRTEWIENDRSAYTAASCRGLLRECCRHMTRRNSQGEHATKRYLESVGLVPNRDFFEQYSVNAARRFRYDFFVPSLNLLIEFHGIQHYQRTKWHNQTPADFAAQKKRDRRKKAIARELAMTLVVVPYWKISEIHEVLNSHFLKQERRLRKAA